VKEPKLLLLDEPLSNLDAKLREEMRLDLRRLLRNLSITALYVTHDQLEALVMSDMVAVMLDGRFVQISPAKELYTSPKAKFIAEFIGTNNFLEAKVIEGPGTGRPAGVEVAQGRLGCFLPEGMKKGDKVVLAIRPESINLFKEKPVSGENILEGKVQDVIFLGDCLDCRILVGDKVLCVKSSPSLDMREGESIFIQLPVDSLRVIP
jgi:iron(III) transport system ATP-binding protein